MKKGYLYKILSTLHSLYGWILILLTSLFLIQDFLWRKSISIPINLNFKLLDSTHYFFLELTSGAIYWIMIYGVLNLFVSQILKGKNKYSLISSITIIALTFSFLFFSYTQNKNAEDVATLGLKNINQVLEKVDKGSNVNSLDEIGNNALFYAKTIEHAKILLKHGADLNHKNKYNSTAISNIMINADVLNFYLQQNVDINNQNVDGNTALHSIATGVNLEKLKTILKYNPNVNLKNNYGDTPLQAAISRRNHISSEYDKKRADAIIEYLQKYINTHK